MKDTLIARARDFIPEAVVSNIKNQYFDGGGEIIPNRMLLQLMTDFATAEISALQERLTAAEAVIDAICADRELAYADSPTLVDAYLYRTKYAKTVVNTGVEE